jgi:hypothetical protein
MSDVTSNTNQNSAPVPASPAVMHFREAFERALPAAKALGAADLITINIDVPTAVTTATGALAEIMALRERIANELPTFDLKHLDELETYTKATAHAQALYSAASAPPEALQALNEQGLLLRDLMYSDAQALVKRGLLSGERLNEFKTNVGYKNLAFDLLGLVAVFRGAWDKVASKTALTAAELDQAQVIGEQIVAAVGAREQAPAIVAEVAQQRQRAFTLFVNSYDQVRRAISFLRWEEDDVETIAPSLYAGRVTSRKKPEPQPTTPPVTTSPTTPTLPGTPAPLPPPVATAPANASPIAAGLPGSSSFVS